MPRPDSPARSRAGPAPGAPDLGGHNPPHPVGPPPQQPGLSPTFTHTLRGRLPHTRPPGIAQLLPPPPRPGSAHAAPPSEAGASSGSQGCGGRTTRGLRYSPAPLCFPSGPHGQKPPAASTCSPQEPGRCRCPRSGPNPAGRRWGGQSSRSERREPTRTDCGRRDINNMSALLRRRGHAPAGIGLRGATTQPYAPPTPGRNHLLPEVGTPRQGRDRGA